MKSSPSHLYIICTSCNACQRAVCSRERGQCPKQVKYINMQCEKFLQEAQKRVNSQVSSFEDDSGLTQTFNQAAREYVTVLTNGVWMNFVKWQTKLIQSFLIDIIHKSCVPFVTKGLLQIINRARHGPNPNMYKDERVRLEGVPFLDGEHARKIVDMFQGNTQCISCKCTSCTCISCGIFPPGFR